MFSGLYYGSIAEVYPPNHKLNRSKTNYEYQVLITHDGYSQIPVYCVKIDPYGSQHNFEDTILAVGYRVLVMFARAEGTIGTILGGYRSCVAKPVSPSEGYFYRHRFNEIENFIDNKGAWHVKSDDGPNANISKTQILFDDSEGERITLDKTSKTITVETKEMVVLVKGNSNVTIDQNSNITVHGAANIKVDGNVTADCNNLTVNSRGEAQITVANDAKIQAKNINVTANGTAKVDAKSIELNGSVGQVLTNKTDRVIDFITGIKTQGVKDVLAGH